MADDDLNFDFEQNLKAAVHTDDHQEPPDLPAEEIGQQPGNFRKNYRKTVCTFWLKNMCMKGDTCGFLHSLDEERMPVCRTLLKFGECKDPGCMFKHSKDEIKECNMYRLGFCIYGHQCRYLHTELPGPPPEPHTVEATKPRDFRNINAVVNHVNPGVAKEDDRWGGKRPRLDNFRDRGRFGKDRAEGQDHDQMADHHQGDEEYGGRRDMEAGPHYGDGDHFDGPPGHHMGPPPLPPRPPSGPPPGRGRGGGRHGHGGGGGGFHGGGGMRGRMGRGGPPPPPPGPGPMDHLMPPPIMHDQMMSHMMPSPMMGGGGMMGDGRMMGGDMNMDMFPPPFVQQFPPPTGFPPPFPMHRNY